MPETSASNDSSFLRGNSLQTLFYKKGGLLFFKQTKHFHLHLPKTAILVVACKDC